MDVFFYRSWDLSLDPNLPLQVISTVPTFSQRDLKRGTISMTCHNDAQTHLVTIRYGATIGPLFKPFFNLLTNTPLAQKLFCLLILKVQVVLLLFL